ncbi:MAG TPA: methyl-accepting chemotaxis protein [Ignavibacteriales bacterium]|nr:methyl-accepting chemotaxis protein [Ignavibacteriales bacterium]
MKWFYDLKISKKLLLGFVLVSLIAGLEGYEGISSLKKADDNDTILYQNNTLPLSYLIDITGNFHSMRANGLELMTAKTPEDHETAFSSISRRSAEIEKSMALLKKAVISADVREKVNSFEKTFDEFNDRFNMYVNLCRSDNDNEAGIFWNTGLKGSRQNVQNALANLEKTFTEQARNRADINNAGGFAASRNLLIYVIVGMIISISLGLFISKIISTPLQKAVAMIREMSKGHLSGRMNINTKDEVGEMSGTLDVFSENMQKAVVGALVKISEGDTNIRFKAEDDKDEIAPAVLKLIRTIEDLLTEVNTLSTHAVEGKLSSRGNAEKFQGGYRDIVRGINATMDAVVKPIEESGEVLEQLAHGDLTARMTGEYKGDYHKIKDNINGMADAFNQALLDVREAVQAAASAASEISSSSEQLAAGAQEQSQQATEVAGAIEQMSKTVYETAQNANEAADVSRSSSHSAEKGALKIGETKKGIERIVSSAEKTGRIVASLSQRTDQIGEITQVIDDIADQTNLLALNAAIEAARAGEQGRGFAVVADEVRKLAERTTKATKEIAETIKSIQTEAKEADAAMIEGKDSVEDGARMIGEVAKVLSEILSGAQKTTDVVLQVAAASEEQSSAAEQISKNIEGISAVTQQSASGTEQIAHAAEDLNRLTVNLQELVARFKLEEGASKNTIGRMAVRGNGKLIGR